MEYSELIAKAESNLKAKNIFKKYSLGEGNPSRIGAEGNYVGRFNVQYFERFGFKFRLIDSQEASTETTIFRHSFKTPIFSAAFSGLNDIADKPLVKIAAGIKESGAMMLLGNVSSQQLQEVIELGVPTVRIIKPLCNLDLMIDELREAEQIGAIAVGTDIDLSYGSKTGDRKHAPRPVGPISLEDLRTLVQTTKLPFIVKGVLSAEDAEKALAAGAGAIVMSNHGGVVIDYAAHPLELLPEVKKVTGNKIPLMVDSGFRRGSDVMKALALGADAVLVGWVLVMALAANGSQGVSEMIGILTAELQRIMSVTGCKRISDIDRGILVQRDYFNA